VIERGLNKRWSEGFTVLKKTGGGHIIGTFQFGEIEVSYAKLSRGSTLERKGTTSWTGGEFEEISQERLKKERSSG